MNTTEEFPVYAQMYTSTHTLVFEPVDKD